MATLTKNWRSARQLLPETYVPTADDVTFKSACSAESVSTTAILSTAIALLLAACNSGPDKPPAINNTISRATAAVRASN
jgi:hypothetical protein